MVGEHDEVVLRADPTWRSAVEKGGSWVIGTGTNRESNLRHHDLDEAGSHERHRGGIGATEQGAVTIQCTSGCRARSMPVHRHDGNCLSSG
jgi:hypothetical protein